ncbi:MAG TPA: hypothetical protein VKS79_03610, partial [Gemmataceae bacterium]|nr:hypothetical protein [Gemmataceae bacterium]
MSDAIRGTWHDDPAHFRKPSRRWFLQVGVVGALGLSLSDYFRLTARADNEERDGPSKEGPAKSVIHI